MYQTTIHGSVQQYAQGRNFQQVQTNYGVNPGALSQVLQAATHSLGHLDEPDRREASRALDTIEDEARDGFPDPGPIRRRVERLRALTDKWSEPATSAPRWGWWRYSVPSSACDGRRGCDG